MTTISENTEATVTEADEEPGDSDEHPDAERQRRPIAWSRVFARAVLPGLALLLAVTAGYFKWMDGSGNNVASARAESVRVAGEEAVAMLSYKPDSADKDLNAARDRLTGDFKDAYTHLIREVVIPGAKEKHISAVAKVNAAAPVSATANHAVVLLFVNQTMTIGDGVPTDTQPILRVILDKVNGRWLVSHLDPE
jgi:Mce-associated membrane protein